MDLPIILLTVSLIWGIAVVTPGPNFFITIQVAIGKSRRSALLVVLGITAGTFTWALAGFLGINLLFKAAPFVYYCIKMAGGCYLIYLGLKHFFSASRENDESCKLSAPAKDLFPCFKMGFLTNLSNPKTAAFVTSLFATAMPADVSTTVGFLIIILMCFISAGWYTCVALLFSYTKCRTLYTRWKTWIKRIAGTLFIFFGVKLAAS